MVGGVVVVVVENSLARDHARRESKGARREDGIQEVGRGREGWKGKCFGAQKSVSPARLEIAWWSGEKGSAREGRTRAGSAVWVPRQRNNKCLVHSGGLWKKTNRDERRKQARTIRSKKIDRGDRGPQAADEGLASGSRGRGKGKSCGKWLSIGWERSSHVTFGKIPAMARCGLGPQGELSTAGGPAR